VKRWLLQADLFKKGCELTEEVINMPELRKDIVTREWVVLAKERAKRPSDFRKGAIIHQVQEHDEHCPFCYGNESLTPPELLAYREPKTEPNTSGWRARVIPNKFAALDRAGELNRNDIGIYDVMNGIGAHEVVIETPNHGKTIPTMEEKEVEEIIWAFCGTLLAGPLYRITHENKSRSVKKL